MSKEHKILRSWIANSSQWIQTVQGDEIPSRPLVTNQAIVNAVVAQQPGSILDVGCGEGWLCRALADKGIQAWGVDGAPALIAEATAGQGTYWVQDYADMIGHGLTIDRTFDVIVFNFSLFGKSSSSDLLTVLKPFLASGGRFVIQTLHPSSASIADPGISGWRHERWECMNRPYTEPYQWYYRSLDDWHTLFGDVGLRVEFTQDVCHPETNALISVIFTLAEQ